ncbi:tetratricopeptide repeat protein [Desulfocicer niacini]
MKLFSSIRWIILLIILFFTASCADHRVVSIPRTHLPPEIGSPPPQTIPESLPQMGKKKPLAPHEKRRPPILDTLIGKARKQLNLRRPEAAFQTLERALNVDGQDPLVWHLMAKARAMQGQYSQAESLARKSNSLSASSPSLKKKNWQVIANALEKQGRTQEAAMTSW